MAEPRTALSIDDPNDLSPLDGRKLPLPLKLFGALCLVGGVAVLPMIVLISLLVVNGARDGNFDASMNVMVIGIILCVLLVAMTVLFIMLGIRLLRNKRRGAAWAAEVLVVLLVGAVLCSMMLLGISWHLIVYGVIAVLLIALSSYVDPSLAEERALQRQLREMDIREQAEEGTLGRDESGKGFITLNFFNLFWIFVVCCVLGLLIEIAYHMIVVDPGHYEDRAGMLFGPFSPIYGCGAVLMTVALNRFHDKSFVLIFLVSAVIGGAFEFFVSWFMQTAFGIVAWDYTGTFLSIGGRTNGQFMCMWGVLGLVWIKLCLPWMLKLVNLIPWNWRYSVTTVCAVLMMVNAVMTLQSLDCWYERLSGQVPSTPIEEFYAKNFDNLYMENRFQSMSIDPANAIRPQ